MTRRRRKQFVVQQEMARDPFADSRKSSDVRWFWPVDWEFPDDHDDAERVTGWYYRLPADKMYWHGPFATSEEADAARAKEVS